MSKKVASKFDVSDRELLLMNCLLLGVIESAILLYAAGWEWMVIGAGLATSVVVSGHMSTKA